MKHEHEDAQFENGELLSFQAIICCNYSTYIYLLHIVLPNCSKPSSSEFSASFEAMYSSSIICSRFLFFPSSIAIATKSNLIPVLLVHFKEQHGHLPQYQFSMWPNKFKTEEDLYHASINHLVVHKPWQKSCSVFRLGSFPPQSIGRPTNRLHTRVMPKKNPMKVFRNRMEPWK